MAWLAKYKSGCWIVQGLSKILQGPPRISKYPQKSSFVHGSADHPAPRRADYEQAFTGVNSDADIISGALFKLSGTLFRVPETRQLSGPRFFLSAGPN